MKIFPIFIPFAGCPQRCIYCQQQYITGSYRNREGADETAVDFEAISKQLSLFCRKYDTEDKEIAFYGGSFTLLPLTVQQQYIDICKPYKESISGIRVSTRPDGITAPALDFCVRNDIRTIELGVQSFSDSVLKQTKRSYRAEGAMKSAKLIKKAGIKLAIQLMPGLPGFSSQTLERTVACTILLKPDFVRIYPTIVIKNTELEQSFLWGEYNPLTLTEAVNICADMTERFEDNGIRVIKTGLHSDLSLAADAVVAGPYHQRFGEMVKSELFFRRVKKKVECRDRTVSCPCGTEGRTGKKYALTVSEKTVSLLMGNNKKLLNNIKELLSAARLNVHRDNSLVGLEFRLEQDKSGILPVQ